MAAFVPEDARKDIQNRKCSAVSVAVIGAGISGLAASAGLEQQGFNVVLLEASDYIGGRLKQVQPFPGFPPVDLGGGFIHGSNTIQYKLAEENNWKVKKSHGIQGEHPNKFMVFLEGKLHSILDRNQPDICAALDAWDDLTASDENSGQRRWCGDKFGADFVNERLAGLSTDAKNVIEAVFTNSHSASLSNYGLAEAKEKIKCRRNMWGFDNYRLEGSYSILISYYLNKCRKADKRLNWVAKEIKCTDKSKVVITNQHGETVVVDYAVVTVPLSILKDGDIVFSPPLPQNKQHAIDALRMGSALKIICRFKTPFWRETNLVCCAKGFITQIWMYSRDPKEDGQECHVLVGFETAVRAAQKVHLSDKLVCERFLKQLDEIFGTDTVPTPAGDNFMDFVYYHWSRHPYVRGGYSAPTAHAHGLRGVLAEPVGRLFFAGEATNHRVSSTVQSAIETGERAAREVSCRHEAGSVEVPDVP